jgi:hypothetical protein
MIQDIQATLEFYKKHPPYAYRIIDLTSHQRGHLAYLLDHKTGCGFITANYIARGEGNWGEIALLDVFLPFIYESVKDKIRKAKELSHDVLKFDNFGTMILKK